MFKKTLDASRKNEWSIKGVVLIPPWTNHPLSQLVQWCGMMDVALPIRWACPRTPAPAPTGPLHSGQSDSHPEGHTLRRTFQTHIGVLKREKKEQTAAQHIDAVLDYRSRNTA